MNDSLAVSDVTSSALWKLEAEIEGSSITKFDFRFTPFATMERLSARGKDISLMKETIEGRIPLEGDIDLGRFRI
jgi:hypothetical protein